MNNRKTHIKGSNGRTFCGRTAGEKMAFVPNDNPFDVTCIECQKGRFRDLDLLEKYNELRVDFKLMQKKARTYLRAAKVAKDYIGQFYKYDFAKVDVMVGEIYQILDSDLA